MIVPIFVIGLISSIITEILKIFPFLSKTKDRKKAVAFMVAFFISLCYLASTDTYTASGYLTLILGAISASFTIYKSLIQSTVKAYKSIALNFKKTEEVKAE